MKKSHGSQIRDRSFGPTARLFRALVENAHDVVATLDVQGRVLYISPATRRYGRDPASLIGQPIWDFLHPDELPKIREQFEDLAGTTNGTFTMEHRVGNEADGWRYKETVMQNLLHEPSVCAIVAVAHDITERKQAEAELRRARDELEQRVLERTAELRESEASLQRANELLEDRVAERTADLHQLNLSLWDEVQSRMRAEEEARTSELRFRSVVEDQTEFIVRWRPDGTRTFVNSSYCRFFGQTEQQLVGRSFFPLIRTDEERRRVQELTRSLTPDNPVASYEHQVVCPDGSVRWMQWNDRALFDESGTIVEFQSVGRDTTGQHEAAERLQRQQEELAHVARLGVMGEMVAAIAHEIGQPLHAISTFASASRHALEAEPGDTSQRVSQWSVKIQEQVDRAGEIIRRLRAFTRFAEENPEPFDLNEALRECLELVGRDLERARVRVSLDLAADLPCVRADRLQVQQVAVNLLRNAGEAMQDTPLADRQLRVTTSRQADTATVAVRDQGTGMSDESFQKAFKAFYTTKPEGTGIGLAISRRIVEGYGGSLWATRNDDRGTTFLFTLPLQAGSGEGA
jgi:PAS domain S-box-containing protein